MNMNSISRTYVIVLVVLLSLCMQTTAVAQTRFHVEASRPAIVRDEPDSGGELLMRLTRGDKLNAVTAQQNGTFYHVSLPNGETGFVSRYVVRLHEGLASGVPEPGASFEPGSGLTNLELERAAFHLAVGTPKGYRILVREAYVSGYDPRLKIPSWVQYRLTKAKSEDDTFPRTDAFDEDAALPPQARATLEDYRNSGYARGHMSPADDARFSDSAEHDTNLLTNIAPQVGDTFNASIWKTLENRIRGWVKDRDDLTIIMGPVFESRDVVLTIERQPATERQMLYNVIGESDVAVPAAFFKIVIDARDPDNIDTLAFIIDHIETEPGPERDLARYLVSIDEIEEATGLEFLATFSEQVQDDVESEPAPALW